MTHSRRTLLRAAAALPLATLVSSCEPVEAQPAQPEGVSHPRWGGLHVVERGRARAPLTFVLLHGFGARGDDLVSLADELAERTPCHFIVPAAPVSMGGEGRAWYAIRSPDESAQITQARAAIEGILFTLGQRGIMRNRVVLGGFSQGAIMSIEVALASTAPLAGIAVLSGRSLPHPASHSARLRGLPIFASHGLSDSRIPFERGEAFMDQASAAGALVERVVFEGDHTIPPAVVSGLATWLAARQP